MSDPSQETHQAQEPEIGESAEAPGFQAPTESSEADEDDFEVVTREHLFEDPVAIRRILLRPRLYEGEDVGQLVAIRPVGDDRTYLGIHMGMFAHELYCVHERADSELVVTNAVNPAIFVPDLGRVVWGYESWWGTIDSEDQLRQITDEDIQNVWYVKLLRGLLAEKDAEETMTDGQE